MNAPHDPTDPLLQSLAEEAADLPIQAAAAARQRSAQRQQTRRVLVQATAVTLLGVITWHLIPRQDVPPVTVATHHDPGKVSPAPGKRNHSPEPDAPIAAPTALPAPFAMEDSPPLPSGLTEEQAEFVKSVPDVPLLFVRDESGRVTRIHVVQR